jgi:AcrR family transcriptional regulator
MVRSRTNTDTASRNGRERLDRAGRQGSHVVEMQRRRLLTATTELVYERGAHGLTAALVAERAGMSRRTFHDIFEDREGCLLAAFEEAADQAKHAVEQAVAGEEKWIDMIRAGLTGLLSFLDYEPGMARLLVVEALASGTKTLNARKRVLERIIAIVDQGRSQSKPSSRGLSLAGGTLKGTSRQAGREPPPLTAEGTVGAVFSVIHARMLANPCEGEQAAEEKGKERALVELAAPLMAMIVQPYLGAAAARKELARPVSIPEPVTPRLPADPFKDLSMRLTYRTARVLSSIAASPGSSSKQIAQAAGITDEGQTSKLLNRLQRYELIHDTGAGPAKGQPRAWKLTQRGESILQAVGQND